MLSGVNGQRAKVTTVMRRRQLEDQPNDIDPSNPYYGQLCPESLHGVCFLCIAPLPPLILTRAKGWSAPGWGSKESLKYITLLS